jgi:hypothetical protein
VETLEDLLLSDGLIGVIMAGGYSDWQNWRRVEHHSTQGSVTAAAVLFLTETCQFLEQTRRDRSSSRACSNSCSRVDGRTTSGTDPPPKFCDEIFSKAMNVELEKTQAIDTEPTRHGSRHELLRVSRRTIAGFILLAVVGLTIYGRQWYRQYQHRRQVRIEFIAQHAQDCADSWRSLETALHAYEEAHKRLLDQLATEDAEAIMNREIPGYLTKAAALHDSVIHGRAICPAQADPSRESNTDRVGTVDGIDVRDLY